MRAWKGYLSTNKRQDRRPEKGLLPSFSVSWVSGSQLPDLQIRFASAIGMTEDDGGMQAGLYVDVGLSESEASG